MVFQVLRRRTHMGSDARDRRDIAVPVFGYKNHAAIDQRHGFIRGWTVTHAAAYEARNSATW